MTDRPTLRRLPGVPRVRLHAAGGRRARLTQVLTGASDWRRGVADALAFTGVALTGTAMLPEGSRWGWPEAGPDEITAALRTRFPALVILGAVLPRQAGRRRLSLLCHAAGNPLVVKLGNDETSFRAENHALELLTANPLPGIATPRPLGVGVLTATGAATESEPIAYVAASALGPHTQRPAIDAPLRTFESDLADRLDSLPATGGRRPDLVPVHGDLTPWNLRRTDRGLALFDWESVGWGPRGSDIAEYRRSSDQMRPWWRGARSRQT